MYKPDSVCVCVVFLFLVVLDVQALNEKKRKKKEKSKSKNPNGWACMLSTWPSCPTSHVAVTLPFPSSYSTIPSHTSLSAELETWTTPLFSVSVDFHPPSPPTTQSSSPSSFTHSFASQHIIISSIRNRCSRRPRLRRLEYKSRLRCMEQCNRSL